MGAPRDFYEHPMRWVANEDEARAFSRTRVRPLWVDEVELPYWPSDKLRAAIGRVENESRQVFDCELMYLADRDVWVPTRRLA